LHTSDLLLSGNAILEPSARLPRITGSSAEHTAIEYLIAEKNTFPTLLPRTLLFLLYRIYGPDMNALRDQAKRLTLACAQFIKLYGEGPVSVLRAPARINILGEHIDYVSYLPTASLTFGSREHDMLMLYRPSQTDRVRGSSTSEAYPPFTFTLAEGPAASTGDQAEGDWLTYLYQQPAPAPNWSNYVKGAAYFSVIKCGTKILLGFDFIFDSGIPAGGGASSSSALVVLASAAVRNVNRIEYSNVELARDASRAEWYVGTRGGSMDHTTICLAKQDHAVLISYSEQQARQVTLPGRQFRWVTFFSQPADKGRSVMIEYNERAAVSRILIPAVIEGWGAKEPERYAEWRSAHQKLQAASADPQIGTEGVAAALNQIEALLQYLPVAMSLAEFGRDYPEAYLECARAFPALVEERDERPLQLRSRALHHAGELRRVIAASQILHNLSRTGRGGGQTETAMRELGSLLNQSHESLRDLYGVSTTEVERLISIIGADRDVYGARLMGGGFGGNVLALTSQEDVAGLIAKVQALYYEPRNRRGVLEGSVMSSTPGDGLTPLDFESVWREAVDQFNSAGSAAEEYRASMTDLLDEMTVEAVPDQVWPVIVAAGKGKRSLATGLKVPKPLAVLMGTPAILHVLRNVRSAFGPTRPPIVIVSPETEPGIREALAGEEVAFVVQPQALGTGDAVLCALKEMRDFQGRALVVWGTQPVIRPETMKRTLKLAALFKYYEMVVPTAHQKQPYAPLLRDEFGRVRTASETHLEQAEHRGEGESNIGMFLLKSEAMFSALVELNRRYWVQTEQRYQRHGGELGFPNELINYFAAWESGVLACPIADPREEQGIKRLEDVARCEQFISALAQEKS
jgi:galactokinase/CTP:molybdopterin cytidylyltransferase MocA